MRTHAGTHPGGPHDVNSTDSEQSIENDRGIISHLKGTESVPYDLSLRYTPRGHLQAHKTSTAVRTGVGIHHDKSRSRSSTDIS